LSPVYANARNIVPVSLRQGDELESVDRDRKRAGSFVDGED
jgi:hypothetical protein